MKKGIESLRDAYERDVNGGDGYIKGEAPAKWQWIMARADMYARYCGMSREKILEAWEEDRRYWYMNYYQECNQPDLTKRENVMSIAQWKEKGKALFGDDPKKWQYECPNCHNVQTMQEFYDAGVEPNYVYKSCASRFGIGGLETCKWSVDGLFQLPCTYVITEEYKLVRVFNFAKKN